jgi:hypothetical protein
MKVQLISVVILLAFGSVYAQDPNPRKATPDEVQGITEALKSRLKDPDSAKVSGVKISADGKTACGYVNAKNSYGGYTGDSAFYVMVFQNDAGEEVYGVVGIDSGNEVAAAIMCGKNGVKLHDVKL